MTAISLLFLAKKKFFVAFCTIAPLANNFFWFGDNFNMIKPPEQLQSIKEAVKTLYKKDVEVKVNLGRNKFSYFTGTVSGLYPALFTITPHDKKYTGKTAFSYSDILCGSVKLKKVKQPL